jgi:hypothetical protein
MSTQICRHIRLNGTRCNCVALKGETYCYFHVKSAHHHRVLAETPDPTPTIIHPIPKDHLDRMQREPILADYYSGTALANRRATALNLDFPPLVDRESIQLALSILICAMAQNRIAAKDATPILYGLQVASSNAAHLSAGPSRSDVVTETVLDDAGRQLAPDVDPDGEADYQKLMHLISQSRFDETPEPREDPDDYYDDDEEEEGSNDHLAFMDAPAERA